jgi:hypothetical protein
MASRSRSGLAAVIRVDTDDAGGSPQLQQRSSILPLGSAGAIRARLNNTPEVTLTKCGFRPRRLSIGLSSAERCV